MSTEEPVTLDLLFKEIKGLRKDVRKIRQFIGDPTGEKSAERAKNNGFNKPQKVTPELRAFLGLKDDELVSRAAVTKRVNQYAADKGLKNGQLINLDDTLKSLLKPEGEGPITFLNLQRFLNPHYVQEPKPPKETKAKVPKTPKAPEPPKETPAESPKEKKIRPKVAKPSS
jgi:chromatin remodeling complex protein RSC6